MEEPTLWSVGVKASKSASLSIASANITTFFRIQSYFHKKITKQRIFLSNLLSTGKCKIIDLSEENILGSVKI